MATTKKSPAKKRAAQTTTTPRAATASTGGRRRRAAAAGAPGKDAAGFPDRIYAIASPHSVGGTSLFTPGLLADSTTVANFESDDATIDEAVQRLTDAGFEVLQATPIMINIAGSRRTYEQAFGTTLVRREEPTVKPGGVVGTATSYDTDDTSVLGLIDTSSSSFADVLEGVAIEQPCYLQTANAFPPPVRYWHLDVPADVSLGCNADRAHRTGVTGTGIRVAMVDTGHSGHPFFTERGYRVDPTVLGPGTADATLDGVGHGTGESANVFATAPDVTLLPVKTANASGALVNTTAAFNAAVALNPDIITNSWSRSIANGPLDAAAQALAAAVAAAVAGGIVVCFSASNGGWGFPAQHPDVLAVGGAFMNPDGSLTASDYSSGFMSTVYPGRRVPDVSGLVGMRPRAAYIMLPIAEGCQLDTGSAGGTHPNGDETPANDGWAAFSGTSASCPQIAGVCALLKQVCPHLTPAEIRDILMTTARDVTTGTSSPLPGAPGSPAGVGPDNATGSGLVDAYRAVLLAKLRCIVVVPFNPPLLPIFVPRTPVIPLVTPVVLPRQPFVPLIAPRVPITPLVTPRLPLTPLITPLVAPRLPVVPIITPRLPLPPLTPLLPFGPGPGPGPDPGPFGGGRRGVPLTQDDVAALEAMIVQRGESPFT